MHLLLWFGPILLLVVLLWLMVRDRAFRTWPWFFAYVSFAIASGVARLVTQSHKGSYFATYWLTDAGYALLGTLAMYEILRKVLRGLASSWWTHLIFPAVVAAGVGLSVAHARYTPPLAASFTTLSWAKLPCGSRRCSYLLA